MDQDTVPVIGKSLVRIPGLARPITSSRSRDSLLYFLKIVCHFGYKCLLNILNVNFVQWNNFFFLKHSGG